VHRERNAQRRVEPHDVLRQQTRNGLGEWRRRGGVCWGCGCGCGCGRRRGERDVIERVRRREQARQRRDARDEARAGKEAREVQRGGREREDQEEPRVQACCGGVVRAQVGEESRLVCCGGY
jgi:hypothetical protein